MTPEERAAEAIIACPCHLGTREDAFILADKALASVAHEETVKLCVELMQALDYLLQQTVDQDLKHGIALTEGEEDARQRALAIIARAAA